MEYFGKSGIVSRFEQLDNDLLSIVRDNNRVEITIAGGCALVMLDLVGDTRVTTDIDVLEAEHQARVLFERYNMNEDVNTFLFRMPENWVERRQRIPFEGIVLDIYAPSNEDLAIMKICAYRETDQKDVLEMLKEKKIDIRKLETIVSDDSELRVNFDNEDDWKDFLLRLNEIKTLAFAEGEQ